MGDPFADNDTFVDQMPRLRRTGDRHRDPHAQRRPASPTRNDSGPTSPIGSADASDDT